MRTLLTWGSGFAACMGVVALSNEWLVFGTWQMAVAVGLFLGAEYYARKDAEAMAPALAAVVRRVK